MKTTTCLFVIFLGALLAACGGPTYAHTDIDQVSQSALPASVNVQALEMKVGGLVTAHVVSYNSDNKAMGNTVESDNPGVLEVSTTTNDHQYAFMGISSGTAHVTIRADGDPVVTIAATVDVQ